MCHGRLSPLCGHGFDPRWQRPGRRELNLCVFVRLTAVSVLQLAASLLAANAIELTLARLSDRGETLASRANPGIQAWPISCRKVVTSLKSDGVMCLAKGLSELRGSVVTFASRHFDGRRKYQSLACFNCYDSFCNFCFIWSLMRFLLFLHARLSVFVSGHSFVPAGFKTCWQTSVWTSCRIHVVQCYTDDDAHINSCFVHSGKCSNRVNIIQQRRAVSYLIQDKFLNLVFSAQVSTQLMLGIVLSLIWALGEGQGNKHSVIWWRLCDEPMSYWCIIDTVIECVAAVLCSPRQWGCLWMKRVMWFGSEDCPGPAHRRRSPVSSLVSMHTYLYSFGHERS